MGIPPFNQPPPIAHPPLSSSLLCTSPWPYLDDPRVREDRQQSPHLAPQLERVDDVVPLPSGQLHQADHPLKCPAQKTPPVRRQATHTPRVKNQMTNLSTTCCGLFVSGKNGIGCVSQCVQNRISLPGKAFTFAGWTLVTTPAVFRRTYILTNRERRRAAQRARRARGVRIAIALKCAFVFTPGAEKGGGCTRDTLLTCPAAYSCRVCTALAFRRGRAAGKNHSHLPAWRASWPHRFRV